MQGLPIRSLQRIGHTVRPMSSNMVRASIVAVSVMLVSGCASTGYGFTVPHETEDAIHYVVIGFGVIAIPRKKTDDGVLATNVKAAGVMVTDQPGLKFGLGYSSSSVVAIPKNTNNALVEVRTCRNEEGISVTAMSDSSPKEDRGRHHD